MAVILPSAFINSLAVGCMSLGMLFVVKDLFGAGPGLVASLGALWSTAYLIGCIVLRVPAGRLRPRTAMTVMLLGSAAAVSAFLAYPGLWQAFASYACFGLLTAFFWPPVMGWLSKGYEGAELNRATSLFSFSWSIGGIISSYMAGLLSERGKLLPIVVAVALFIVNAAFVTVSRLFVRYDAGEEPEAADAEAAVDRSTPLRYPAWLGVFLVYAVMGVVINVFPVFASDELGMNESTIGLALTIRAAATTVGFLALGRLTFWQFKRAAIPALSIASAVSVGLLAAARNAAGFAVGFTVVGLLQAMVYNNSLFYGVSGAPDRDKRASVHESVLTFGQISGSVSGGFVYQALSMPPVFVGLALLLAAGAAAQAVMIYAGRRPPRAAISRRS
ncbi:MAG: MFS transporter [Spirochaetaceae bacterium]|nr:MFS transporter [Spirochaetaceae bacterium]